PNRFAANTSGSNTTASGSRSYVASSCTIARISPRSSGVASRIGIAAPSVFDERCLDDGGRKRLAPHVDFDLGTGLEVGRKERERDRVTECGREVAARHTTDRRAAA